MSSEQGRVPASGPSPAEDAVDPHLDDDRVAAAQERTDGQDDAPSEAEITAAGGKVVGEAPIAAVVDPSRVRRAPRYKRFAVLGGLLGVLIAAIATPLANYDSEQAMMQGVGSGTLFLVLAGTLVPFGILVSCAVAMFSDRAARTPERAKKKRKTKEPR
ncbi:hypothetical protein [Ruania albidiflava]|uniref:hypothetical protein n=1 Tax=Ruania albidiflava TaxID=366586 RepID=UPI0023F1C4C0|nr:hypothetical protein [Ruania albidiflava]